MRWIYLCILFFSTRYDRTIFALAYFIFLAEILIRSQTKRHVYVLNKLIKSCLTFVVCQLYKIRNEDGRHLIDR